MVQKAAVECERKMHYKENGEASAACCVKEGLSYPIGDEEDSRGGRRQQAGDARQGLTMLQLCVDIVPRITHPASTVSLH